METCYARIGRPAASFNTPPMKGMMFSCWYFFNIDEGCQLMSAREKSQLSFNGVFQGALTQGEGVRVAAESRRMNCEWRVHSAEREHFHRAIWITLWLSRRCLHRRTAWKGERALDDTSKSYSQLWNCWSNCQALWLGIASNSRAMTKKNLPSLHQCTLKGLLLNIISTFYDFICLMFSSY